MNVEERVRTMLLPVFGLTSIDQVRPEASLVRDLGAESLDFVQIIYLIEREFEVVIQPDEILSGAAVAEAAALFSEGKLTDEGASLLNAKFAGHGFDAGMGKQDIFVAITVRDLAAAISMRIGQGGAHA